MKFHELYALVKYHMLYLTILSKCLLSIFFSILQKNRMSLIFSSMRPDLSRFHSLSSRHTLSAGTTTENWEALRRCNVLKLAIDIYLWSLKSKHLA